MDGGTDGWAIAYTHIYMLSRVKTQPQLGGRSDHTDTINVVRYDVTKEKFDARQRSSVRVLLRSSGTSCIIEGSSKGY